MKNNKIWKALGNCEQDNIAPHIAHLDAREQRVALMYLANDHRYMMEAIKLLGFRDEEVLVFATAAMGMGRSQTVPHIVKSFCRNTAIARRELGLAARRLIQYAVGVKSSSWLYTALQCLELTKEQIKPYAKDENWNNESTLLAIWILHANTQVNDDGFGKEITKRLRKLAKSEVVWKWLQENKEPMGVLV